MQRLQCYGIATLWLASYNGWPATGVHMGITARPWLGGMIAAMATSADD